MKRFLCLLAFSALVVSAAELTGKWSGSFDMTNSQGETNASSAYMDLTHKDGVVTGAAGPSEERNWPIQKGKLDGRKLTFELPADGGLMTFDLTFDGEIVQGNATGEGRNGERMSAKLKLKRIQ